MIKIPRAFGFAGCSEISCIDITDKNGAYGLYPCDLRCDLGIRNPHFRGSYGPISHPLTYFGNLYAHEMGGLSEEDLTTGISFAPTGEAYHMARWLGIFLIAPLLWIMLFTLFDSLCGDTRKSPWGRLMAAYFAHVTPEAALGGVIDTLSFMTFALVVAALSAAYVMPIVGSLLKGPEQVEVRRIAPHPQRGSALPVCSIAGHRPITTLLPYTGISMNKLVLGNLVHRPLRSLISALAIAIEVIMILSITAILLGKISGFKARQNGIGMDMIVRPATTNNFLGMSSAAASIKVADVLAKVPHVAVAAPVNIQLTGSLDSIYGIDYKSFNDLQPFSFISGGPFQGPDDVIVDDFSATGKKVGDTISIWNHPFRISGIVEHGKGGRKFIPIDTMGKQTGTEGKASLFYLRTDNPPKYQDEVRNAILATPGMNQYNVATAEEYLSAISPTRLPYMSTAINVVVGIALVIGFLVIFQSMYTAVMERTREIGVLKSLGASRLYIIALVLRETGTIAAVGIALGVAASYALSALLEARFPTLDFVINLPWVWKAVVIAFAGSLLGAVYPAYKAASKDPIDALAYE